MRLAEILVGAHAVIPDEIKTQHIRFLRVDEIAVKVFVILIIYRAVIGKKPPPNL